MSARFKKRCFLLSASLFVLGLSETVHAAPYLMVRNWGALGNGQEVKDITLTNDHHIAVRILTYGGIVQSVETPDRNGKVADIALGFPTLKDYVDHNNSPFFGAILGRVANRIAGGSFTLEGKVFHTPQNDGVNTIHGGAESFTRKLWSIENVGQDAKGAFVRLKLVSPDGDQGFPGNLTTLVTYRLGDDDTLSIRYQAETDAPTIINLSTHNYWNLSGEGSGSVENEELQINADRYVETDPSSIPTGKLVPVKDTAFDFNKPRKIREHLRSTDPQMLWPRGYDKCWVLTGDLPAGRLRLNARLTDPQSGRVLEVSSDQPGLQFYTSNSLDGRLAGPSGQAYRQGDAVAFEPEHFPDSVHHSDFPSTELKPGEIYDHTVVFAFSHL
ncbi:galactose mutarotase [Acetobacteraceae bacterium ESL0709]|nr:galactose mutarotase [Acetobacteraceae bacterium ESL0697]MDF7678741.1 galactose mutarotase [Acetobacteraceae bacterium ESL0709]